MARVAVVVGAAGSVGIMLRVGHRGGSAIPAILVVLFTGWVLSPFAALVLVDIVSKRWSVLAKATLYSVMVIVTLGSLAIYADVVLSPPRPKPAFMFLVVPLGSWLLMMIVFPIAAWVSGRRFHRDAGA